jgi:8-oxo-dGTP pyrophosphatase MutT (NUDIX family)
MLAPYTTRKRIRERIRRLFGGMPCRVQVAALPWRQTDKGVEIMLITSRDTGRWILPKGWPEGGEELYESAAREAAEEAGLTGKMSPKALGGYLYGKRQNSGMERRCEVLVFAMEVEDVAASWPEKDQRSREWFSAPKAASLVHEQDLAEIIRSFGLDRHQIAA